jgi:hypothetical protein
MDESLTITLPQDQIGWLREYAENAGLSVDQIVSVAVAAAQAKSKTPSALLNYAGIIKDGPPDGSVQKGFGTRPIKY